MGKEVSLHFPPQKLPQSKKTEKWAKQCIDAAEDLAIFRHNGIRESYKNKLSNYNLANDILDTSDIEQVCNPLGISQATFPAKMQNYPIANPKIDLLVGEERKRRFSWQVRVTNDDAISEKEKQKKDMVSQFMMAAIQERSKDEAQFKQELQGLQKYMNFEWQDLRERSATHILNYLYKSLDLKEMFSRGFEDALIAGEEIYCADIEAGEPILRRVNPLNIHTVRSGESPYIEDADIIVEDSYQSPGDIIDSYYDYLTQAQVKQIDDQLTTSGDNDFISIGEREQSIMIDGLFEPNEAHNKPYGEYYDTEGNLRVLRVCWASLKKVGKLKYFDEEGLPQETIVPETYKANKKLHEEVKWMWVREWWEGTRIGKDIYIKIQPRPIQFRSLTNLSKCSSGYVGIAYNINSSKAKSLMDRMKPYQYLYNVFMYRTELAFAKAKGRIATMDLAMVPDHWDPEKWMYFAEIHGWAVKDSFKEAKKGAAQGKLAGQMAAQAPVLDMELGNYIQQHIMMLQFIENQLGEIAGVTKQRQGQVENRELVGNVERSITQSSHITEKWFSVHNHVKRRAMACLLETAKYAFKEETDKRFQYVLDDLSTSTLKLDGPVFNEADYGLVISDTANDQELMNTMKQLAHAGIQNDKMDFSTLMDIYLDPSISSMRRKIEQKETEKAQRDQEMQQMQQQMQQQQLQAQQQMQQEAQQFELAKMDREYDHKKDIEEMKMAGKMAQRNIDMDRDGIPDILELEKQNANERVKEKEIEMKRDIEREKLRVESEKIKSAEEQAEKDRRNKIEVEKLKIKNKPKPTAAK